MLDKLKQRSSLIIWITESGLIIIIIIISFKQWNDFQLKRLENQFVWGKHGVDFWDVFFHIL